MSDVWPGRPFPLGATWDGGGTNFSIFSEHAEGVDLCLFDEGEEHRIQMTKRTALNWHCYVPGVSPGTAIRLPGSRAVLAARGPSLQRLQAADRPLRKGDRGRRRLVRRERLLPYFADGSEDADLERHDQDDSEAIPKSIVIDDAFIWEGDRPPLIPFSETLIYETHVKGFTMNHPDVREDLRGTYAGLASDPAVAYLRELGVTAVELLPVHHIADESFLYERGLKNYWGYSTIGYLAPHSEYAATGRRGEQVREFKGMVKALHRAGIEVILDVVYNHTAEGNHLGPMLSFKGVDNRSYYRLMPDDPRYYMDFTGTGNSLNPVHPSVLRLIMDSLRYWVIECHVDGFRFDLASALRARVLRRRSAVGVLRRHPPGPGPVAGQADRGAVGRRPGRLSGGQLPSAVVGVERHLPRHGSRLLARSDQRGTVRRAPGGLGGSVPGRRPRPVRFDQLHHRPRRVHALRSRLLQREAQRGKPRGQPRRHRRQPLLESRRRGPHRRPRDHELRARQRRNFLTTLMLSQGTPMLLGGDEFGRTQHGNNNAWCQDYEISWFSWEPTPRGRRGARGSRSG